MSTKLFAIAIDVEESALGAVLRILNSTPGVAKFHLDLDALPKKPAARNGGPGSGKYERNPDGPRTKDIVIMALVDGPKNLGFLRDAIAKAGRASSGLGSTLNELRRGGIAESAGTGLHKLTERALAEIKGKQAAAALPAPDPAKPEKKRPPHRAPSGKSGMDIIAARMADFAGPVPRKILIEALVENGLSPRTIDGASAKLKANDIIRSTEPGVFEFTPKGKRAHMKGQ